jgi:hypothetical protein
VAKKIWVELSELYKKRGWRLNDMRGKQEVSGKDPVEVEETPFIRKRIRWGELVRSGKKGSKK